MAGRARTVVVVGGVAGSLVNFRGPLIMRMVAAGHRVVACAPGGSPALRAELAACGATFREVPIARGGLRPDRDLLTMQALVRVFREERPDVVLAYTIKPVIWGSLAARWAGVPETFALITGLGYTLGQHPGLKPYLIGLLARALYRLSLRGATRVFFQNPDDLALFERTGLIRPGQAALVNGSGVDLLHFRPANLPDGAVFLLIARLLSAKGLREYVEAARRVRSRHPDVTFYLVGASDDANPAAIGRHELAGWIDEGVITHLGRLKDVRPAIARSSVYVLPSYYGEGTPRTILEAMAMGRPIVTTDVPGCRETVEEGVNGHLVPPRDAARLSEVLLEFVRDPARIVRMGKASRRIAAEKYDVHKVNHAILTMMGLLTGPPDREPGVFPPGAAGPARPAVIRDQASDPLPGAG